MDSSKSYYDILTAVLTLLGSLGVVILAVSFGWYVMWKLFLSRFQFVRELLSVEEGDQEAASINNKSESSSRRLSKRKLRRD